MKEVLPNTDNSKFSIYNKYLLYFDEVGQSDISIFGAFIDLSVRRFSLAFFGKRYSMTTFPDQTTIATYDFD